MSQDLVDVAPAVANSQTTMASDHMQEATELRDPVNAVFSIHELLVMILSPFSTRELSRVLSVSKSWNRSILDSPELRRTLFLESKQPREYLQFMTVKDPKWYDPPHECQPVIVREPVRGPEVLEVDPRVIVELHPVLGTLDRPHTGGALEIDIRLPDYGILTGLPASAFLSQPPLGRVTIEYWQRYSRIEIPGGVTFGAILEEIQRIQIATEKVFKAAIARSPRFGGHLLRVADRLTFSIRTNKAILNDAEYVKRARRALVKAKELAVLDKLEGKSA